VVVEINLFRRGSLITIIIKRKNTSNFSSVFFSLSSFSFIKDKKEKEQLDDGEDDDEDGSSSIIIIVLVIVLNVYMTL
jgi:hypothetical protein